MFVSPNSTRSKEIHPQDLFKQGGRWNSVTVDHYSDWFAVDLLNEDITAANVISVTKAHFARYGLPDTFLSDNGPLYTSQEFLQFAKTYIVSSCLPGRRIMLELPVKLKLQLGRPRIC